MIRSGATFTLTDPIEVECQHTRWGNTDPNGFRQRLPAGEYEVEVDKTLDKDLVRLRLVLDTGAHSTKHAYIINQSRLAAFFGSKGECPACAGRGTFRSYDTTSSVMPPPGVRCWSATRCDTCLGTGKTNVAANGFVDPYPHDDLECPCTGPCCEPEAYGPPPHWRCAQCSVRLLKPGLCVNCATPKTEGGCPRCNGVGCEFCGLNRT